MFSLSFRKSNCPPSWSSRKTSILESRTANRDFTQSGMLLLEIRILRIFQLTTKEENIALFEGITVSSHHIISLLIRVGYHAGATKSTKMKRSKIKRTI